MRTRRVSYAVFVASLCAASAVAQGFWDKKEWKKWSADDCKKILQESPWAHRWAQSDPQAAFGRGGVDTPNTQTGGLTRQGNAGAMTTDNVTLGDDNKVGVWYVVQLRTADPIRQAFVRQQEIQANYDSLDGKGRAAIDEKADKVLSQKSEDLVIVRVYYGSNIPLYQRELVSFWQGSYPSGTVPQDAFLNTAGGKKISPIRFISAKSDANEFDLVFPRVVDGEPVISGNSKILSVEFHTPAIQALPESRVLIDFKLDKMQYHGALAY